MSDPYLGEIRIVGFNFAPEDWAACDGGLLDISQNSALFTLLSDRFGGDGRTTMGLPNLKDRIPLHAGTGPGLTPRTLAETGGEQTVTLNQNQIPGHQHSHMVSKDSKNTANPSGHYLGTQGFGKAYATSASDGLSAMASNVISSTGQGLPHQNMPPFLGLFFCICLDGIFPNRP